MSWDYAKVELLYAIPLLQLIHSAYSVHLTNFHANKIQLSSLLSIKTGNCPEDCAFCPQSGHYKTDTPKHKLLETAYVIQQAQKAKDNGATRFCIGSAWKSPPKKDLPIVADMIRKIKSLGLETCATLGMLNQNEAQTLAAAGLDYYNHNLDTSPSYYKKIISTRTYQDRLDTIKHVQNSDMKVCCGGIIGMGETRQDRIEFLLALEALDKPPQSIPINRLIPCKGTPLENEQALDNIEFIRTIAVTRIMFPTSVVRLSAGRASMSQEMQVLCFLAGANSFFLGDKLLTTKNNAQDQDFALLTQLGMTASKSDPLLA